MNSVAVFGSQTARRRNARKSPASYRLICELRLHSAPRVWHWTNGSRVGTGRAEDSVDPIDIFVVAGALEGLSLADVAGSTGRWISPKHVKRIGVERVSYVRKTSFIRACAGDTVTTLAAFRVRRLSISNRVSPSPGPSSVTLALAGSLAGVGGWNP